MSDPSRVPTRIVTSSALASFVLAFGPGHAVGQLDVLPLEQGAFVENRGQWPPDVRFAATAGDVRLRIEQGAIGIDVVAGSPGAEQAAFLRLRFEGASPEARIEPIGPPRGMRHYYEGNDPEHWVTDVPAFGSVTYRDLHPGIDLVAETLEGVLAYRLQLESWADLDTFRAEVLGAESLAVAQDGGLSARLPFGTIHQSAPVAWYETSGGARTPASCGFRVGEGNRYEFVLDEPRENARLVIDPGFTFSSYLGGPTNEVITRATVDEQGRLLFAGSVRVQDFPGIPGPVPYFVNQGVVLARVTLARSATTEFIAFLSGEKFEDAYGLALGPGQQIYLAGTTTSPDFPTTPGAFDETFAGTYFDGFVTCLDSDASSLVYSTAVGGDVFEDLIHAIDVDDLGRATVVGETGSPDFPTTPGAYQTESTFVSREGFVTRLDPTGGTAVYSTLVGGVLSIERFLGVAVDENGNAFFVGGFVGDDYPKTPGAFEGGQYGGSVSKLDPTGSALLASTWIGGVQGASFQAVEIGPSGNVYIAGTTASPDYPVTPGVFDTFLPGWPEHDAVVTCLDTDLSTVVRSTFFGEPSMNNSIESILGMSIDLSGVVTVAGTTTGAPLFPITAGCAVPVASSGSRRAFLSRLDPSLEKLLYSTFLHGDQAQPASGLLTEAEDVAIFPDGSAVAVGRTLAADFPTTPDAPQASTGGGYDGFVSVLDMLPFGVERFGTSTPACQGPIWIGVTEQPQAGGASFGLTSSGSPPSAVGLLALGTQSLPGGLPVLGVLALLDPASVTALLVVASDQHGWCEKPLPLPASSQGKSAFAQFLWLNTPACGGLGTFSASSALELTVQ